MPLTHIAVGKGQCFRLELSNLKRRKPINSSINKLLTASQNNLMQLM